MTRPLKPAATITDHVERLRARGMSVDDPLARQWLPFVSYYRLSAYWYPARILDETGHRLDQFRPGTTFTEATQLYEADRKLRALVLDGMERIEIGLRTQATEVLCDSGPVAYKDRKRFRPSFKHEEWMTTIKKRIARAGRRNEAIQHHKLEYDGQLPLWVLTEILDFSDVSRLFEGMLADHQRQVAEALGFTLDLSLLSRNQQAKARKQSPLVPWMEQLTIIRNVCAHHGRLWNKSFAPAPTAAMQTLPGLELLPEDQSERLYGALAIMARMVRTASPGTKWPLKVARLLEEDFLSNPLVSAASLGIPHDWKHQL